MSARARLAISACVFVAVAVLGWREPGPSGDGTAYLWMAQQFALGNWSEALSTVFPPGFPLAMAPLIALAIDPWAAGVLVGAACLALLVVPVARIAADLAPGTAAPTCAALLLLGSPHLLNVAAEVYSEPPFLLLMAWGTVAGLARRWWWCGALAGAAYWVRPEGLLLAVSFVLVAPRRAWRGLVGAAAGVLALGLLRAAAGQGVDPLPMLAFHELRDDLPHRGDVLHNLLEVPIQWVESLGVASLLALAGLRHCRGIALALPAQILLQTGAILTFVVRKRFFLSCAVPVLALAGRELAAWPVRVRRSALTIVVAAGLVLAWPGSDPNRAAEVEVGRWLAQRLPPGAAIVTDLMRVAWFAGRRPPPPRHFSSAQLLQQANDPAVQCVVLSSRSQQAQFAAVEAGIAASFARVELPVSLRELAGDRGIVVFLRR
ncbi:MAG: hypothetical protein WAT39_04730 [Planctomycetota bacterium]